MMHLSFLKELIGILKSKVDFACSLLSFIVQLIHCMKHLAYIYVFMVLEVQALY